MSTIELRSSNMCSVVYRTINCLTNDNLINVVNPKIDRMLPLVPRVESLIKQVELLSSQLTAKFDKLPEEFRNPDMTEYSQQLRRTAKAAIVTASTTIASQSTIVGGKDGQQSSSSNSGELSEDLRKRKIEEWIAHLTVSQGERGQEYDAVSELTPDDSVSNIGLNTNKQSQQIDEARISGRSSDDGRNAGTPENMNTGRKNSTEILFEEWFTCSDNNGELPRSRETFSRSGKNEYSSDSTSENTMTEYRADKVDTSYDEKSAKDLLAYLGTKAGIRAWDVNGSLFNLVKMQVGQGLTSISNIIGTLLYLVEKGANVNALDAESNTPLYYASETGNTAVFEKLVEQNADVSMKDKNGWNALHIAASKGRTPIVDILLKSGINVEQNTKRRRCTALALAAYDGRTSTVKCLLNAGASINVRDVDGCTPLHSAYRGHVDVVEMLVKAGASVDARDNQTRTPLIRASSKGHVKVVETLLKARASIDARGNDAWTPLFWASHMGYVDVVEALLKAGASVDAEDKKGRTPLIWASVGGHVEVVKTLLKAGAALNSKPEGGETALMCSAYRGHKQITELLLAAGADIRARDNYGSTVLHFVLFKHSGDCAKKNACDICAGSETRQDMVMLLCEKGADPSAKNRRGHSPLSMVYKEGVYSKSEQEALAKVLKEYGAK